MHDETSVSPDWQAKLLQVQLITEPSEIFSQQCEYLLGHDAPVAVPVPSNLQLQDEPLSVQA